MREAIYVVKSEGGKVATEFLPILEAHARCKKEAQEPPAGAVQLEVWESGSGVTKRIKIRQEPKDQVAPGTTFEEGNKEVLELAAENRRRLQAGLPTVEEQAAMDDKRKAIVAAQAKAAKERQMSEDDRRRSQGRPTVSEEEAAAAARLRAQDAAETAAARAHENEVRKAQGRPSLDEEDAMITKRRLESLAAKGIRVAAPTLEGAEDLDAKAKAEADAKAKAEADAKEAEAKAAKRNRK